MNNYDNLGQSQCWTKGGVDAWGKHTVYHVRPAVQCPSIKLVKKHQYLLLISHICPFICFCDTFFKLLRDFLNTLYFSEMLSFLLSLSAELKCPQTFSDKQN